jgi:predicted phage tail protein
MRRTTRVTGVIAALLTLAVTTLLASTLILGVPVKIQEHSQWCWAGSSQAVLAYYGTPVDQCVIAGFASGRSDCCASFGFYDESHPCNYWNYMWGASAWGVPNGSLQGILTHWGVTSEVRYGPLSQSTVMAELGAQRPFVMRFGWTGGGGHFLIGYGHEQDATYLDYMDPWPGNGATRSLYTWVVAASDHQWTHTLQLTTTPVFEMPGAPAGLTAGASASSITLSWSAPSTGGTPTSYTIEAGSSPGLSNLARFSTGGTGTSYAASGVANGLYYVRVRAANGAGTGPPSNEVALRVGPTPPDAPSGLTGSASGSTLTLSWTAPAGGGAPTQYVIEAGTASGLSNLANLPTGSIATQFAASGVADGLYYLRVRASNGGGTSAPSNEIAVRVGPPAPGAPSGLTGSATGSTVMLSWTAPSTGGPAAAYLLEAGTAAGLSNLANFSTGSASTSYSATGVADGTYYIRVRAMNAAGTSGPSNEIPLVVGCTAAPAAPTGLQITANTGGAVSFRWNAPAGAPANAPTGYVLEAGSQPGQANLATLVLGSPATTFSTSGVGSGIYYVRVRGRNACGTGTSSNEVTLIVP